MATIQMTAANFDDTIENNDIVILDFWAEWCGPCRQFGPIFEKVSDQHEDIAFGKVNTEVEQQLAAMFQVRSIPMVAILRDGIPIFAQPGMVPEEALSNLIEQVRGLDMTEVRAEYDKHVAEAAAEAN